MENAASTSVRWRCVEKDSTPLPWCREDFVDRPHVNSSFEPKTWTGNEIETNFLEGDTVNGGEFDFKHHLAEFIAISASHATTMGHIKRGDLDAAMVLVPPPQVLEEMSVQMVPLLDKQIAIAKQRKTLEALRGSLLPKLMSGEVRVAY